MPAIEAAIAAAASFADIAKRGASFPLAAAVFAAAARGSPLRFSAMFGRRSSAQVQGVLPAQPRTHRQRRAGQERHSPSRAQSSRAWAVCSAILRACRCCQVLRLSPGNQPDDFRFGLVMSNVIARCRHAFFLTSLSPVGRGNRAP